MGFFRSRVDYLIPSSPSPPMFAMPLRLDNFFPTLFVPTGPVPPAFDDFWRMVWEQRSASIVMLTNLQERHKVCSLAKFAGYKNVIGKYCYSILRQVATETSTSNGAESRCNKPGSGLPRNCCFHSHGNIRKSWVFVVIVFYSINVLHWLRVSRLWRAMVLKWKRRKSFHSLCSLIWKMSSYREMTNWTNFENVEGTATDWS